MSTAFSTSLERYFKLKERQTNIKTEIFAGFTTFITMAYIIFVNPDILSRTGMPYEIAIAATILGAAICTLVMGLYANLPVAMAPGMGINVFFATYVCGTLGLPWQTALGAVFISGITFLLLTVTNFRQKIIDDVPTDLKCAVAVGMGIFISFIGLQNAKIVVPNQFTGVSLGDIKDPHVLLALSGIMLVGALFALKVRAAMLISILAITLVSIILGLSPAPEGISSIVSFNLSGLTDGFFSLDIMGAIQYGLISVIFTMTVFELFDNIGTLIGVTRAAPVLIDKDGHIVNQDRALMVDSFGTMVSSFLGSSAVVSYVESSAGIHQGGRSGLTSVIVALLFFCAIFFAPLAQLVPPIATAPALIVVGAMMMRNVTSINFSDFTVGIPAFLTITMMAFTYSISNGFSFGFISYCLLKILTGRYKEITPVMWVVTIIFCFSYALH